MKKPKKDKTQKKKNTSHTPQLQNVRLHYFGTDTALNDKDS